MLKKSIKARPEKGNVLLMVLGGMVALATLGLIGSTLVSTVVSGSQRSNLIASTAQILTQAAYTITTEANTDGSFPVSGVPSVWLGVNPLVPPAIGTANAVGIVPAASAAPRVDAWGSNLGYCTFTAIAQGSPVFAVISAGPDKLFQTDCTQAFADTTQGDDAKQLKTAANVLQGVGGTVFFGDPVANMPALEALTTAHAGEMRIAKDTGFVYVNKTGIPGAGNWLPIGGWNTSSGQGAPKTCPGGYVLVPEFTLPDGEYVASFCVMQYEARKGSNIVNVVTADLIAFPNALAMNGFSWRQSKVFCSSADARLITESQWLSIAHQVTSVDSNWTGGIVGSGTLARGWNAQQYVDFWGNNNVAPKPSATCLYNTGGDVCGATGQVKYRRTLYLPNGSVVWDMTGNMPEWTDAVIATGDRYNGGVDGEYSYGSGATTTNMPINKQPPNGWGEAQGMGHYVEYYAADKGWNSIKEDPSDCTAGLPGACDPYHAFMRGGMYNSGLAGGMFTLNLYSGRSNMYSYYGFRCTR